MGVDVCGWIECRDPYADLDEGDERWSPVINIHYLTQGRDYDAFGSLFGEGLLGNGSGLRPIAPRRGLPPEVSTQVRVDADRSIDGAFGHSWISWAEIQAIAWDELGDQPDRRIHIYTRDAGGTLHFETKALYDATFAEGLQALAGKEEAERQFSSTAWRAGAEWEFGGKIYRVERLRRSETRGFWSGVFLLMEYLAHRFGADGVRLVVWFIF
jgi:hypothetical protein